MIPIFTLLTTTSPQRYVRVVVVVVAVANRSITFMIPGVEERINSIGDNRREAATPLCSSRFVLGSEAPPTGVGGFFRFGAERNPAPKALRA